MPTSHHLAEMVLKGFHQHYQRFSQLTMAAATRFAQRDWAGQQQASSARIVGYDTEVDQTVSAISLLLDGQFSQALWFAVKRNYQSRIAFHPQAELAETFYNSVFCRLFHRRYFHNQFIFVESNLRHQLPVPIEAEYRSYFPAVSGLKPAIRTILARFQFGVPFIDLERDIRLLLRAFIKQTPALAKIPHQLRFDILKSPFYRNKAAYLIGRVLSPLGTQPFIIAVLHHPKGGLFIDTLLTERQQLTVIFGFARAYFMVQCHAPSSLVRFLQELMPQKSLAELYSAIGFHKQGKTEFYRELQQHWQCSDDQLVAAPGVAGLVMEVFTLPSFPYVFKVIKDQFGESKAVSRDTVKQRYLMVKRHDRAGRMADTLEFRYVALPKNRFSPELWQRLQQTIPSSIELDGEWVIIKHLYIERRMTPLDIRLTQVDDASQKQLLFEYGQAIKDMVGNNIFPGDMLLKNFGVTRHQRVVFYDYDEVRYLQEMRFRDLPKVDPYTLDLADDQSFGSIGADDVFPEQIALFALAKTHYKQLFCQHHQDLLSANYWQQKQLQLKNGILADIYPYPDHLRFYHYW